MEEIYIWESLVFGCKVGVFISSERLQEVLHDELQDLGIKNWLEYNHK